MIDSLPVSRLVRHIKELLETNLQLSNLWIEGEVSNISRSSAGHVYFTLKDAEAQMRCVMFRRANGGASIDLGDQVLVYGNVSIYEQRGELQLVVEFVQPAGVGARQAEFERLKNQLAAEGLFDESRKRPLPPFPMRVGVVTSPTGAVFHDICNVLGRRWALAEVVLAPTPVQGMQAGRGIAEAIRQLNDEHDIDVIIVARGGGSAEELWAFNEEVVARAIYASSVPIVSGIGHETDFTIADLVADLRAPTPSAAAETVAPDWRTVFRQVEGLIMNVTLALKERIANGLNGLERAGHRLEAALPDFSRHNERLDSLLRQGHTAIFHTIDQSAERIYTFEMQLRSLDPKATLTRGYSVVQRREGKEAVTSVAQVRGRDRLDVFVKDGRFPAEVSRQYGF
jgi:exodeoxyribonuclease VII large subunit